MFFRQCYTWYEVVEEAHVIKLDVGNQSTGPSRFGELEYDQDAMRNQFANHLPALVPICSKMCTEDITLILGQTNPKLQKSDDISE